MEVFGEERLRLCGRVRQTGPDGMDGGSHRGVQIVMIATTSSHRTTPPSGALSLSLVCRLVSSAPAGGARVHLRSSPRHYDAAASPLLLPSPTEQDFLESVLAFSRPKEKAGRGHQRKETSLCSV